MLRSAEEFKAAIIESGYVLDPEGIHHEFAQGDHGQKLHFDQIPTDSPLFEQWIEVLAESIFTEYPIEDHLREDLVLVSVANGTNRVVPALAESIDARTRYALTEKVSPTEVSLTNQGRRIISSRHCFALIIEDVGTTGNTTATAVESARSAGAPVVEALVTWQRKEKMTRLIGINAVHHAVIDSVLPTFSPQECRQNKKDGFCARGWELIERAKA